MKVSFNEYKGDIKDLIELSLKIFNPHDGSSNSHHQIDRWQKHLKEGGKIWVVKDGDEIVGYNFGYPEKEKTFHYWMGGILEEYRNRGYGTKLLGMQEKYAKNNGFFEITVNTYQHMWPNQYQFLIKHGYKIYKTEETKWSDGSRKIKSFFKKIL